MLILWPASDSGKLLNRHVLVRRFSGSTAVDLEADESELRQAVIGLRVIDHVDAIDGGANAFAFATDDVFVPVILLEGLLNSRGVRLDEHLVAAGLVIER